MPGPGSTDPNSNFTTQTFSLYKTDRYPTRNNWLQPGPGYYEYSNTIGRSQKFPFGIKLHEDPFKMKTIAGPADYNPKPLVRIKSGVISNRPAEKSLDILRRVPGPGTYNEPRD